MNSLMSLACCGDNDDVAPASASDEPDATAPPQQREAATTASPKVVETSLRATDDGTRNYRLERRAATYACEALVRGAANAAIDCAEDANARDALDARCALKAEMEAAGLAESGGRAERHAFVVLTISSKFRPNSRSKPGRGCRAESSRRRVAATPSLPRGEFEVAGRSPAAGCRVDIPRGDHRSGDALPLAFGSSRRPTGGARRKKRKKNPPKKLEDAPNPHAATVDGKYWAQRFHYFSLFDCGVRLDPESWYSVTPEKIALAIAGRCRPSDVVLDACCGCGGNAIALARRCARVVAVDVDAAKLDQARHNAAIYGVLDKIDFVHDDAIAVLRRATADVVFLSPPWGGPSYGDDFDARVIRVGAADGVELVALARKAATRVAYPRPRQNLLL